MNAISRLTYAVKSLFAALSLFAVLCLPQEMAKAAESQAAKGAVLLLGVKTYRPGSFEDLVNPCNDIEEIRKVLADREDFLVVGSKCDLTAEEMRVLVNRFQDELGNLPEGSFGLVYFSGHGISLEREVFLFGKQAKLDLQAVKARQAKMGMNPNSESMNLISREAALRLFGDLSPGEAAGSPVIIVVDACRSTPIGTKLGAGVAGSTMMRMKPQVDTLIAFSAAHGSEAVDSVSGVEAMSPYAYAFRDALVRADGSFSDLFTSVRKKLRGVLSQTAGSKFQFPAEINALESNVCVGECMTCTRPTSSSTTASQKRMAQRSGISHDEEFTSFSKHTLRVRDDERPSVSPMELLRRKASETVWYMDYSSDAGKKFKREHQTALRMDVFWCDFGPSRPTYERASAAAAELSRQAASGKSISNAMLTVVRLRRFSAEQNLKVGYQLSSDEIRYTPESPVERGWTEELRVALASDSKSLLPRATTALTPGYLSVFFCDTKQ